MTFTSAVIIAIIYFIIKFVEMRFIIKESEPIKLLVRDTLVVFISSISGMYIINHFNDDIEPAASAGAFTGNPEF